MKRASIDIGSNTILLLAGDQDTNNRTQWQINRASIAGLGKGIQETGHFSKESMEAALSILDSYHQELTKNNFSPKQTIVTATEAARRAENADLFFSKVKRLFQFDTQILTAEGEAYYTAVGALCTSSELSNWPYIIMDIGGASTELIQAQQSQGPLEITSSISLPFGAVVASEWSDIETSLQSKLQSVDLSPYQTSTLIAVAGTMTSVAAMFMNLTKLFDAEKIHGKCLSIQELEQFYSQLKTQSTASIRQRYPFLEKRAETIKEGLFIALRLGKLLKIEHYYISTYGLRYGTFLAGNIDSKFLFNR